MAYDNFKDYMYYLLHKPLKTNTLYKLFTVLGAEIDEVKETIFRVREQSNILTATGKYLDLHGKDRDMYRYKNEDDESFRERLIYKFIISQKAGTLRGLELVLKSLGYDDANIKALYLEDGTKWAEFYINLNAGDKRVTLQDLDIVHNEIIKVKQASSKPNYYAENKLDVDNSLVYGAINYKRKRAFISGNSIDCSSRKIISTGVIIYKRRKIVIKGGSV